MTFFDGHVAVTKQEKLLKHLGVFSTCVRRSSLSKCVGAVLPSAGRVIISHSYISYCMFFMHFSYLLCIELPILACFLKVGKGVCADKILNSFDAYSGSTTGALEAAYTQATGKPISLSEQQLVDCAGAYNNFGCNGGLPSQAFEYIKHNGGLDTEESYPYKGVNGLCQFKASNVGVKVLDSVNITLVRRT